MEKIEFRTGSGEKLRARGIADLSYDYTGTWFVDLVDERSAENIYRAYKWYGFKDGEQVERRADMIAQDVVHPEYRMMIDSTPITSDLERGTKKYEDRMVNGMDRHLTVADLARIKKAKRRSDYTASEKAPAAPPRKYQKAHKMFAVIDDDNVVEYAISLAVSCAKWNYLDFYGSSTSAESVLRGQYYGAINYAKWLSKSEAILEQVNNSDIACADDEIREIVNAVNRAETKVKNAPTKNNIDQLAKLKEMLATAKKRRHSLLEISRGIDQQHLSLADGSTGQDMINQAVSIIYDYVGKCPSDIITGTQTYHQFFRAELQKYVRKTLKISLPLDPLLQYRGAGYSDPKTWEEAQADDKEIGEIVAELRLSENEELVLASRLNGETIDEFCAETNITPNSYKSYMRRIKQKAIRRYPTIHKIQFLVYDAKKYTPDGRPVNHYIVNGQGYKIKDFYSRGEYPAEQTFKTDRGVITINRLSCLCDPAK